MPVGFTFDQAKCTGCQACILACTIENGLDFNRSWRTVFSFNDRHYPDLPASHLSLACNHCERPACLFACPANAYAKDSTTGFVVLDARKCIGCRYCTWACPYGAPKFDEALGVVSKCTFCDERQEKGLEPACVASCPTGALDIGDMQVHKPPSNVPGLPATKIGPAIVIEPVAKKRRPTESATAPSNPFVPTDRPDMSGLSMKSEWPLAAFTYLTTLLFALLASSVGGGPRISLSVFLGIAATAVVVSTAHLGRKTRAWHAALNPGHSWLSREILLFSLLVGVGAWYLAVDSSNWVVGALTLATGVCTLVSIDGVYRTLPLIDRRGLHSAGVLLTWVMLTALFLNYLPIAGIVAGVRLFLYVQRKAGFQKTGRATRPELSVLRIVFGFLVPGILWSLTGSGTQTFVIATVLLGEMIDRFEFYLELDVVTPEKQMIIDLDKAISVSRASTES